MLAGLCVVVVLPIAYFGEAYSKMVASTTFSIVIAFTALHLWLPLFGRSRSQVRP